MTEQNSSIERSRVQEGEIEMTALFRLLSLAQEDTEQASIIASFLLAWWDPQTFGGFALSRLIFLDDVTRTDVEDVFLMIGRLGLYPHQLGVAVQLEFHEVIKQWHQHHD